MGCSYTQTSHSFTANGSEGFCARFFSSLLILAGIALAVSVVFFLVGLLGILRLYPAVDLLSFIIVFVAQLVPFFPLRRKRYPEM